MSFVTANDQMCFVFKLHVCSDEEKNTHKKNPSIPFFNLNLGTKCILYVALV